MTHRAWRILALVPFAATAACWIQRYPAQPVPQPGPRVVVANPAPPVPRPPTPAPVAPGAPVEVHLINQSGVEICYLYLSIADQPWGDDRLGPQTTVPSGTEVVLDLDGSIPLWDLRVDDCNRQTIYEGRRLPPPYDGVWRIDPPAGGYVGGYAGYSGGGYVVADDTGYDDGGGYTAPPSGPQIDLRTAAVAAWYLGASASDLQDLVRGDCGFIDSSDLQDFCRGDCGFIDNGDVQDLCRGDCGFIDDSDLQDFCRGDCGFIDDSTMADVCRAL